MVAGFGSNVRVVHPARVNVIGAGISFAQILGGDLGYFRDIAEVIGVNSKAKQGVRVPVVVNEDIFHT
jgi:hypothetical protein